MNNYTQRIQQATTKEELKEISKQAFILETSTTYNKILNMCIAREKELEHATK